MELTAQEPSSPGPLSWDYRTFPSPPSPPPPSRHLTTIPPNAYLLQFLSRVHHAQISVKNYKATERQKTYFEETEQASEPDSRAGMLELSGQRFKITMIDTLRALMEKVDNTEEEMDNISRDMKVLIIKFLKC